MILSEITRITTFEEAMQCPEPGLLWMAWRTGKPRTYEQTYDAGELRLTYDEMQKFQAKVAHHVTYSAQDGNDAKLGTGLFSDVGSSRPKWQYPRCSARGVRPYR